MNKAILLPLITLLLGIYAVPALAQEKSSATSYKIIIRERGGEEKVYEYGSIEELRNDPRLKDRRLPGFEERGARFFIEGATHGAPFVLRADGLRFLRDSVGDSPFRKYLSLPEGHEIRGSHHIYRFDSGAVVKGDVFKRLEEARISMADVRELQVFHLREDSVVFGRLPAEVREFLTERGEPMGEGERVMIFRLRDGVAGPETTVIPRQPQTELMRLPEVERRTDWLEELSVYPNPANDRLQIRFQSASSGPASLRLIDFNGRVVYEEQLPDAGLLTEKSIPVPQGQKGMYLLQLKQGERTYSHRVLLR